MRAPREPGEATIAAVCGAKGSRKTTLVKRCIARLPSFVVWDVKGEYTVGERRVPGARLWTDVREFGRLLQRGELRVEREVFACPAWQFDAFCRFAFACEDTCVVIEELQRHCEGGKPPPPLYDLFDRPRHAHVDMIVTASKPTDVPRKIRGQVDELLVSRFTEPEECTYLRGWLGGSVVARVRDLEPNLFLRIHL